MEKITRVLEKINQGRTDQPLTLSDLMPLSFAEIRNTGQLSRDEALLLFRSAQKEKQNNILYTARALTRANPLLRKEMGRARYHGATPYGYDDIIVPRADEFAAPGAVSSMFSPAGYLTELYREARGLHQKDSPRSLDKRRPDLAKLTLSQSNLDDEISTLALSNEQLETALMAQANTTYRYVYYEKLSASRNSGVTPYHAPFGEIRETLAQQDFVLPDHVLGKGAESAAQMALYAGISPELYAILTEKTEGLSEIEREALLKKNFPAVNIDSLMDLNALANYYGLPRDEIQALPGSEFIGNKSILADIPFGSDLKNTPDIFKENNTRFIKTKNTNNEINVYLLTRKNLSDYSYSTHFNYIDLIPQDNNQFCVNFCAERIYPSNHCGLYIGTAYKIDSANNSKPTDLYSDPNKKNITGKNYSISVTPKKPFPERFTIIVATEGGGIRSSACELTLTKAPTDILYLNKLLRLAKATGITPLETQRALTRLKLTNTDSETDVLHRFCEALLYRKRYTISMDKALVLSGADISTVSYDGQLSQFDRLFNNPPLNGLVYPLGGAPLDLTIGNTDRRLNTLTRALGITKAEFPAIYNVYIGFISSDNKVNNTLSDISKLYFITLLMNTYNITATLLDGLLWYSPNNTTKIINMTDAQRRSIINYLWRTTEWLNAQNISADTLYVLQKDSFVTKPTNEMNTLFDALHNGGIDSTDDNTLRTTMAPVIAAAMQLENPEQGEALLYWLDNNHPNQVPLTRDFWKMLINNTTPNLQAKWCETLAQRVLLIRTLALSSAELRILSKGAKVNAMSELRTISDFHRMVNRCGEKAVDILAQLYSGSLEQRNLWKASGVSRQIIQNALQIEYSTPITTWQQLAKLPDYIDIADTLRILPQEFNNLLTITEKTAPTYDELHGLSQVLQAGLNEQQTQQIQNPLEQRRSEALSGEYRSLVMKKPLANRDDIWRELLMDGKVSADITTTRLADAIAGIQLYINRTIAGDEPGAENAVLERQFFKDWDTYNKRYSTWAGVSQLVYYPENTIDPAIRIGQTGMMNTMLEQLSQSELNSDTLENAFRQYLTAFEQVANLKVVSGYHDAVDIDEGNTWFIGTSQTEPKKYYWRKADHSKCQNGRFAANAWSDWKEITCAINPYQEMVRPVIYRSRLYLFWIEKQVRKDADGETDVSVFNLKLTHIKYDGSWASPFSYNVTDDLTPMEKNQIGLYCTGNNDTSLLTIACYQIKDKYDFRPDDSGAKHDDYCGWSVLSDMTIYNEPDIGRILTYISPQLDNPDLRKVNAALQSYGGTLTAETQPTPDPASLELNAGYFHITKTGGRSVLEIDSEVNTLVDMSWLAPAYRQPFKTQVEFKSRPFCFYNVTGINYTPQDARFPAGECTYQILAEGEYGYAILISIPGEYKQHQDCKNISCIIKDKQGTELYPFSLKLYESSDSMLHFGGWSVPKSPELSELTGLNDPTYTLVRTSGGSGKIGSFKYKDIGQRAYFHGLDKVQVEIVADGHEIQTFEPYSYRITENYQSPTLDVTYQLGKQKLDVTDFINEEEGKLSLTFDVRFNNGKSAANRKYTLSFNFPAQSERIITLHTTTDGAQYMEWDTYRTRLNTLFARQLIERANNGIDAILSPKTQDLREPKPGEGMYVTLTLKPYDKSIHGSDRKFTIMRRIKTEDKDHYAVTDGMLSTTSSTEVRLFIPLMKENRDYILLCARYQSGITEVIRFVPDGNGWQLETSYPYTFPGLESVSGLSQPDEPMDFSGANALYFWELFYYTPMMVAMRLLQEQNFTEANHWLSYIWRPAAGGAGDWRVRPLKEDTSWNADPLDSVDPDAVAQNDPMHYKVSTLMKLLDLLIARGDSAYRMLERDTLNEAKMWYMQALGLLGDKPLTLISSNWDNPSLSDAADQTKTKQRQDEISRLRNGGLLPEVRTANTLTGLFLPQQNEKLLGYWQTLEMRLFNLRNNLAIDGQPLSLPVFAAPADPAALLSAASAASGGSKALPSVDRIPAMRFPQALDSARSLTGQLMQFGSTLQGLIERQDAEAMSELLQNQAGELMLSSLRMQEQALAELDAEKKTLEQSRAGAQSRFDSYRTLYDENVSAAEQQTMAMNISSSVLGASAEALHLAAAAADMAPNVFGMAVGGSRWGSIPKAIGIGLGLTASAVRITSDNISQSEAWRRRR